MDKIKKAIENNNDLYQEIFKCNNIKFKINDDIAYSLLNTGSY